VKKRIYTSLLLFGLAGISLSIWFSLGNAISQKYELNDPDDCISMTSGNNLCLIEDVLTGTLIFSGILVIFSIYKLALDIKRN
jgi:hypothetical protein